MGILHKLIRPVVIGLLLTFFLVAADTGYSQIELSAQTGYLLTSDIPVTKGDIEIKSNVNYGLGINYKFMREASIVFEWDIQKTSADLSPLIGEKSFITNVTNQHFLVGVDIEPGRGKAKPFGSFTTGITIFHPDNDAYEDEIKYTIALGFGGKFYLSDRIGIKIQARLILPLQFGGGTFWCGTGGCGLGVSSWTTYVQGDFSGGVVIRI